MNDNNDNGAITSDLTRQFDKEDFGGNGQQYEAAITMLTHSTLIGYSEIRDSVIKQFHIPKQWMPSFYMMTKNRPRMMSFSISQQKEGEDRLNASITLGEEVLKCTVINYDDVGLSGVEIDSTVDMGANSLVPNTKVSTTSFVGQDISVEEAMKKIEQSNFEKRIDGALIDGTVEDYVMVLAQRCHKLTVPMKGNLLLLNSYDGAEHEKTEKKRTNVISFSSKLFGASTVGKGSTGGTSRNILTWQQIKGEEKKEVLFPALQNHYQTMREMEQNLTVNEVIPGCKIGFFELHDGKMLYLLTQHSLFNRKHKPFLLCKCKRGAGILDPGHQCELISHVESVRLHDRSEHRWNRRRSRDDGHTYTAKNIWIGLTLKMMGYLTLVCIQTCCQGTPFALTYFI